MFSGVSRWLRCLRPQYEKHEQPDDETTAKYLHQSFHSIDDHCAHENIDKPSLDDKDHQADTKHDNIFFTVKSKSCNNLQETLIDETQENAICIQTSNMYANAKSVRQCKQSRKRRCGISSETFENDESKDSNVGVEFSPNNSMASIDLNGITSYSDLSLFGRSNNSTSSLSTAEKFNHAVTRSLTLSGLSLHEIEALFATMENVDVTSNTTIIQKGELSDKCYIVQSGKFEQVSDSKSSKKIYNDSGIFNELSLMHQTTLNTTIRSITPAKLWCIDRNTYRQVIVLSRVQQLWIYRQYLKQTPLFAHLSVNQIRQIAETLKTKTSVKNEFIAKIGDKANEFILILKGQASVIQKNLQGQQFLMIELHEGDSFGQEALLRDDAKRSSSLQVTSDVIEFAYLAKQTFQRLIDSRTVDQMSYTIDWHCHTITGSTSNHSQRSKSVTNPNTSMSTGLLLL